MWRCWVESSPSFIRVRISSLHLIILAKTFFLLTTLTWKVKNFSIAVEIGNATSQVLIIFYYHCFIQPGKRKRIPEAQQSGYKWMFQTSWIVGSVRPQWEFKYLCLKVCNTGEAACQGQVPPCSTLLMSSLELQTIYQFCWAYFGTLDFRLVLFPKKFYKFTHLHSRVSPPGTWSPTRAACSRATAAPASRPG